MTTILETVEAAIVHVKEAVIENNEQNGARFADWQNGAHAACTYIDGESASIAGDHGGSLATVIVAVDHWLKGEVAFEAALESGRAFINWTDSNDVTRDVAERLIDLGMRGVDAPDWSDDYGGEYLTTLRNGDVIVWGKEFMDGRELLVLDANQVVIGSVDVPSWREAA